MNDAVEGTPTLLGGNFVLLGGRLRVGKTSNIRSREEGLKESGDVGAGEGLNRR